MGQLLKNTGSTKHKHSELVNKSTESADSPSYDYKRLRQNVEAISSIKYSKTRDSKSQFGKSVERDSSRHSIKGDTVPHSISNGPFSDIIKDNSGENDAKQSDNKLSDVSHIRKNVPSYSKKKRLKAMDEFYSRKNTKLMEKRRMNPTEAEIERVNALLGGVRFKFELSDFIVNTAEKESLESMKQFFAYKAPCDKTNPGEETLKESQDDSVDILSETEISADEATDTFSDTEALKHVTSKQEMFEHLPEFRRDEEGHEERLDEDRPVEEWNTIRDMRRSKRLPKMTQDEIVDFEKSKDPFHEDGESDFQHVTDLMMYEDFDSDSIKGFITAKAKKKLMKLQENMKTQDAVNNRIIMEEARNIVFNENLRCYVDACAACGISRKALKTVQHYRRKHGRADKFIITDIAVYNSLIRGLVKERLGVNIVREVFTYLKEDGLQPTMETYMICLACIGNVSEYDLMIASFIVKDMIKQGFDVEDIFNQCSFMQNERHNVYWILKKVIPGYEPKLPLMGRNYNGDLVNELNTSLPSDQKVVLNPLVPDISREKIMQQADVQFQRELEGFVSINSVFKGTTEFDKQIEMELANVHASMRQKFRVAFVDMRNRLLKDAYEKHGWNLYPFFCLFPLEDYINILCKEAESWMIFSSVFSPQPSILIKDLARKVHNRYIIQQMTECHVFPKLYKVYSAYIEELCDAHRDMPSQAGAWRKITHRFSDGNSMEMPDLKWSQYIMHAVGSELFNIITENAEVNAHMFKNLPPRMAKVFFLVQRQKMDRLTVEVKPHPVIQKLINTQTDLLFPVEEVPSLCPPVPFTSPNQGGNFLNTVKTVRLCGDRQVSMLKERSEESGPVFDALNILGACAWRINKPVLDVTLKVFKEGGNMKLLDIPEPPSTIPKPTKVDQNTASREEVGKYFGDMTEYRKACKEANSLWWSALYKLSIADQFKDETFWLPVNLDFRGRTYPVPPHLNHQGQDFVRALMMFANGKPIGEKGLDWLKIHLINTAGLKKRSSNTEKLEYAGEIMPSILDSADKPLTGEKWWMTNDNPWQTLATCIEISNAIKSGDPPSYVSHFPVHQDGSCNGLQHYAALGRDDIGAKSVNLFPYDQPSDVYSDVVDLIMQEIDSDIANKTSFQHVATICKPYLNRKVIKQSIMTTVYGVTMFGANKQIQGQLEDLDMPGEHLKMASQYLSTQTFRCFKKLFCSARSIQSWFDSCAQNISSVTKHAVEWVTPLNYPCVQHYYKTLPVDVDVKQQYFMVKDAKFLVADQMRQKNGFAPNFIHSLDSTHMTLTALYCYRKGLTFMSVHDCFWTHAADVDTMNKITREQFVALHNQPILHNLSDYFVNRYIDSDVMKAKDCERLRQILSAVPETGDFDLNNVLKSTYFFS